MHRVIAVAAEKGGVGKTFSAFNIAAGLAAHHSVLAIDLDAQANLTTTLLTPEQIESVPSMAEVLTSNAALDEVLIAASSRPTLFVAPGSSRLADAQVMLTKELMAELRLRHILGEMAADFDYVVIDTPPGRGFLSINALAAADDLILVSDPGRYSSQGIGSIQQFAATIRKYCPRQDNPEAPAFLGLIVNKTSRCKVHDEAVDAAQKAFGNQLLAVIPHSTSVDDAIWKGQTMLEKSESKDGKGTTAGKVAECFSKVVERITGNGRLRKSA